MCRFWGNKKIPITEKGQIKAVCQIENHRRLLQIWRKSQYDDVRMAAINKLRDQGALAEIAQCEYEDGLRAEAVKRLEDKALLLHIAETDVSDFVRAIARAHCVYTGDEPWMPEPDAEISQEIIDYLQRHAVMGTLRKDDGDESTAKR